MAYNKLEIEGKCICTECRYCKSYWGEWECRYVYVCCKPEPDKYYGNYIGGFYNLKSRGSCEKYNYDGNCKDFEPKLSRWQKIVNWWNRK